jgi:hypothetical protein
MSVLLIRNSVRRTSSVFQHNERVEGSTSSSCERMALASNVRLTNRPSLKRVFCLSSSSRGPSLETAAGDKVTCRLTKEKNSYSGIKWSGTLTPGDSSLAGSKVGSRHLVRKPWKARALMQNARRSRFSSGSPHTLLRSLTICCMYARGDSTSAGLGPSSHVARLIISHTASMQVDTRFMRVWSERSIAVTHVKRCSLMRRWR